MEAEGGQLHRSPVLSCPASAACITIMGWAKCHSRDSMGLGTEPRRSSRQAMQLRSAPPA